MNFRAIIFGLAILAIYFGMHLFLYYSVLYFFNVTAQKVRWLWRIVFLGLSVSFIGTMILTRLSSAILIKYFYIWAAFWAGCLASIFLAWILAWILFFIFRAYKIKFILGILALVIPSLYCTYGVWNAQQIDIKNVEIALTGLPNYWQGKKIVQLSDAHLGQINSRAFAEKIVAKVNGEKPDLILITGDLFDGMGSEISEFMEALNKLEATEGVYFVTGNHEIYLGVDTVIAKLEDSKIQVLDNEVRNIEGLQIVGLSYPQFGEVRENSLLESIPGYDDSLVNILMYHTPTSIMQQHGNASDQRRSVYGSPDINFDIAKKSGINLQLSGHTHRGQFFPYNLIVDYIYGDYSYGLKTEGDFNIYITSGAGTWGPPIRNMSNSEIAVIYLKQE